MKRGEEILAEIFESLDLPQMAAMALGGQLHPERTELKILVSAQREAWNEAIEAAGKVARSYETKDWESYDPRTIQTAIRSLHREE